MRCRLAMLLIPVACLGIAMPSLGAGQHAHAPATATAPPSGRFATDAALREGMAGVRRSVQALDHARHGHLDAAQVRTLASAIRADVAGIFAKCHLAPDADAALHPILASLLEHAAALERDPAAPAAAIDGLQSDLRDYERRFDDSPAG